VVSRSAVREKRAKLARAAGRPQGRGIAIKLSWRSAKGAWLLEATRGGSPKPGTSRSTCTRPPNVLDKLPQIPPPAGKADLPRDSGAAPERGQRKAAARNLRRRKYGTKYDKADLLIKDRDALLTFYRLPARALQDPLREHPSKSRAYSPRCDRRCDTGARSQDMPADGVQAGYGRGQNLAPAEGGEPV